mmetsp:Transcript_8358/g.12875  ORF Transcript_8358/g.12875 Transcript_8358/m.12875 type:complete len:126 (+) Transcript_8358:123-500(+)
MAMFVGKTIIMSETDREDSLQKQIRTAKIWRRSFEKSSKQSCKKTISIENNARQPEQLSLCKIPSEEQLDIVDLAASLMPPKIVASNFEPSREKYSTRRCYSLGHSSTDDSSFSKNRDARRYSID